MLDLPHQAYLPGLDQIKIDFVVMLDDTCRPCKLRGHETDYVINSAVNRHSTVASRLIRLELASQESTSEIYFRSSSACPTPRDCGMVGCTVFRSRMPTDATGTSSLQSQVRHRNHE